MKPIILDGIIAFTRWDIRDIYDDPNLHYLSNYYMLGIYDPIFLIDFGPWKAGEKPYTISLDMTAGMLVESDCYDYFVKSCKVKLVSAE